MVNFPLALFFILIFTSASHVFCDTMKKNSSKQLYWNVGSGLAYGPENSVVITSGDDVSASNGTGPLIYTGIYFQPESSQWGISSNIGLHGISYEYLMITSGEHVFKRKTFDLSFMYTFERTHRISLGVMHHFDIKHKDTGVWFREDVNIKYDDSNSIMLGYDYLWDTKSRAIFYTGTRLVNMKYKRESGITEKSPQLSFLIGISL